MIFTDYKWTAKADLDNPKVIAGNDRSELNRSEGYEMLYFIRNLAKSWGWTNASISSYQRLEKVIRLEVPSDTRTHGGIKAWIEKKYKQL